MSKASQAYVPPAALSGSMRDFRTVKGADLLSRIAPFYQWQNLRRQHGLWPFSRSTDTGPATVCAARDDQGGEIRGVNFASQDYLSLSAHPAIKQTAQEIIAEFGVHSAGSAALVGNTSLSVRLEEKIAEFLGAPESILFPTGWAAGFGAIKGLVRSTDHVVLDVLAHTCLQEGAMASTRNVYRFRHLQLDDCRRVLSQIRERDTENGVMVVTEGLFSMDSDTPDLLAFQELCNEFGATLLVDVAHDLGNLGPDGRGHIGLQDMVGKVDLVMGSFSKTFGSNGGFVTCRNRALKEYLRFYSPSCTFSNALSPMQAATVLKAFEIIEAPEGAELRAKLMHNIVSLRTQLIERGFEVYGDPSAIVCVKMGNEALARLVSRQLPGVQLIANLVEFPAVAKGQARFRMQVMANHTAQDITDAVDRLHRAYQIGLAQFEALGEQSKALIRAIA
jgi:glycine C-acetyltransferase